MQYQGAEKIGKFSLCFGGTFFILRGLIWLVEKMGLVQTPQELVANRSMIGRMASFVFGHWDLWLSLTGIFILACIRYGSPKSWISRIRPMPLAAVTTQSSGDVVASIDGDIDDLRHLREEGDALLAPFYVKGSQDRPTLNQMEDYQRRVLDCARRDALNLSPKDVSVINKPWPNDDNFLMVAQMIDRGLINHGVEEVDTFRRLWECVEHVKQLVDKVENRGA